MLNEQICKKCIRQYLDGQVTKPNDSGHPLAKRLLAERLQKHKKNFNRWFKKSIERIDGKIPCPYILAYSEEDKKIGEFFYAALNIWYTNVPRDEVFSGCLFILEQTVTDGQKDM